MKAPLLVNLAPAASTDVCRWCFEYWGMTHRESMHVPIFHVLALAWYRTSNSDRPVVVDKSNRYQTETGITAHFDPLAPLERRLIPDGELGQRVLNETNYFHKTMRIGTVQYMYWNLLKNKQLIWPSFTNGTPWAEALLAQVLYPFIKFALVISLSLNETNAIKGIKTVSAGFDRVETALSDGRPYLLGERFTLADLTFAASAAPIILADGYAGHMPKFEDVPQDMQSVILEFRQRPAGIFAQRMYDLHRNKIVIT